MPPATTLKRRRSKFVLCIGPREHAEVDLDLGRVYQALPTEESARSQGLLRVIDNSGEDYLFSADQFVEVQLPPAGKRALLKAR